MKNQRGAALIIAISVLLVLLLLTEAVLILRKTSTRGTLLDVQRVKSKYLAEAGVYKAIWYLKGNGGKDINWQVNDFEEELGIAGKYKFSISKEGSNIVVASVGESVGDIKIREKIKVRLKIALPEAFESAVLSQNFLRVLSEEIKITGKVVSNDRVVAEGLTKIDAVSFSKTKFPELDNRYYLENIKALDRMLEEPNRADKTYLGNQVWTPANPPQFERYKKIYVQGDVVLKGGGAALQFSGPGTFIVTGKISFNGAVRIDNDVVFVARGGIIIDNGTDINQCVFYSPQEIQIKSGSVISGAVIGRKSIKIEGEVNLQSYIYSLPILLEKTLKGKIQIAGNAKLNGTIISDYDSSMGSATYEVIVEVGKNAVVDGIVFSKNIADIKGTVNGSVVTVGFKDRIITGGTINRSKLPEDYILPHSLEQKLDKAFKIVSWEK